MQQIRLHGQHRTRGHFSWVIIGVPQDNGGCMVIASDSLTYGELESVSIDEDYSLLFNHKIRMLPRTTYVLRTEVKDIKIAIAPTWPEAIAALFNQWGPDEGPILPPELPTQTGE